MGKQDLERLTQVLETYPADLMRALMGRAGAGDLRSQAKALLAADNVERALAETDESERAFLAFIARAGGECTAAAADWWLRHRGIDDPEGFVERLAARGIIFYITTRAKVAAADYVSGSEFSLRAARKLWLPQSIGWQATNLHPPEKLSAAEAPVQVLLGDPWEVIRRLFLLIRHLSTRPLRLLGLPERRRHSDPSELSRAVDSADLRGHSCSSDEELLWLECIARQLRLVEEVDGYLHPASHALSFFEHTAADQRRRILDAAVRETGWLELERLIGLRMEPFSPTAPNRSDVPSPGKYAHARRHVLKVLSETALPGEWHKLDELAERAMEWDPDFLVRRRLGLCPKRTSTSARYSTYQGFAAETKDEAAGLPATNSLRSLGMLSDWRSVEGAFVMRFITGPMHWLGFVDLGGPAGERLFRLTQAGAEALGVVTMDAQEPTGPRFVVQPDFEIIAPADGESIGAIVRLSRIADVISFDRAALLRLTKESVLRALDNGLSHADVLRILSDEGRVPVPQNVEYSISDWAIAYNRYELRTNVAVVEVDDSADLDALMEALPDCLQRVGPTAAIVQPQRLSQVRAALGERQDVIEIDHEQGLSRIFDLDERMIATPVPSRWHWYAEHVLSQVADRIAGKGLAFRLTPASIQAALALGFTADEVEQLIRTCATKELTSTQRFLLRGWLGHYSAANLARAVVLALPAEAVADALSIPEMRAELVARLGPTHFTVRPAGVRKVLHLLRKAGIEVAQELKSDALLWPPSPTDTQTAGAASCPPGESVLEESHKDLPGEMDGPLQPPSRSEIHETRWGSRAWKRGDPLTDQLALLEEAIAQGRQIAVEYASVAKDRPPVHWVVTPQNIQRSRWGEFRLRAYCHVRGTQRVFDLSRVISLTVLEKFEE